jgi:hypothetical protein
VFPTIANIGCAQTDPNHGMAWGRFTFLGRVRSWDGLIALVRLPVRVTLSGDRTSDSQITRLQSKLTAG